MSITILKLIKLYCIFYIIHALESLFLTFKNNLCEFIHNPYLFIYIVERRFFHVSTIEYKKKSL